MPYLAAYASLLYRWHCSWLACGKQKGVLTVMDLGPQVDTSGKYPQNYLNTSKTFQHQPCFE